MLVFSTDQPPPSSATEILWVYNGLDVMLTQEIYSAIQPMLSKFGVEAVYNYEKAMMGPVMEMQCRGTLIDMNERERMISILEEKYSTLVGYFEEIVREAFSIDTFRKTDPKTGKTPSVANSPQFLKDMFYKWLGYPEQFKIAKGKREVSCDRSALEKLSVYPRIAPLCNILLAARDANKKLGLLRSGVDSDLHFRAAYNIAGTETGRFSSSSNAFMTGSNMQNITEELRHVFISPPGKKLGYVDLEQAESRLVALLAWLSSGRDSYLLACEGGDLHTTVCRMVWPKLPWTGDLSHDKKKVAGQTFYRSYSYRDMAKRGGHGSNYYGQPPHMAKQLHIETKEMAAFQREYFTAFPEIPLWHGSTKAELQTRGILTTPVGFRRQFFGRLSEDSTLREAIAFVPQSSIAHLMNMGMWRLWYASIKGEIEVNLLAQIHDAVMFEYDESKEAELIPRILNYLTVPISIKGRVFSIPTEALLGWNWAKQEQLKDGSIKNPDGLKVYHGEDTRKRLNHPTTSLMDRRIY